MRDGRADRGRRILRAALLGFVACGLALAAVREFTDARDAAQVADPEGALAAALGPGSRDGVFLILARPATRCAFCVGVAAVARAALAEGAPAAATAAGRLSYRELALDGPAGAHLRTRYGLFTVSLLLVEMKAGVERRVRVLPEAWGAEAAGAAGPGAVAATRRVIGEFLEGGE